MGSNERWPPAYDADDFRRNIESLVNGGSLEAEFFEPLPVPCTDLCQGDVVELNAKFPFISDDGSPRADSSPTRFWLIWGNSCDLDRTLDEMEYTQVVPLLGFKPDEGGRELREELGGYRASRRFLVPAWSKQVGDLTWVANLPKITSVHRSFLNPAHVKARMSLKGWTLFHCCTIRYLARDDGRYDIEEKEGDKAG